MRSCCCITFVGLMAIAIKKISSKTSVNPINIPSISAQIQEIQSSRSDERQDTIELQAVPSQLRIINVAPIHSEDQSFQSLENIGTIQPMNIPIERSEFISSNVENTNSEETPEVPNQTLCLNNQKLNPNLISFAGLTFLCVISFILGPIYGWHIRFANDLENIILTTHIYYCMPTALPIFYFILNPKHLTKATILLFEGL